MFEALLAFVDSCAGELEFCGDTPEFCGDVLLSG
jgi:hypothetical protein